MDTPRLKEGERWRYGPLLLFWGRSKRICLLVLFILSCVLAWDGAARANPLDFYGNWQYQKSGNGESQESFFQSYNVDFDNKITQAVTYNGSVRYNRNWVEGRVNEILYPTLGLVVDNDIFRLDLSGTSTERMDSEASDMSDRSWDARLFSAWDEDWWPDLRLSYGEERSRDDQSPRVTDTESSRGGLDVDWDAGIVKAFCNYYKNEGTDRVDGSENTSESYLGRLRIADTFWDNRFNFSFSEQYSRMQQEHTGPIGTPIKVPSHEGYSGVDSTPDEGALDPNPALVDGNIHETAVEAQPDEDTNIGVELHSREEVDLIYLYTIDNLDNLGHAAGDFGWDLYVSDDGSDWDVNATDLHPYYNSSRLRFEFEISAVKKLYLKLVTVQTPSQAVSFSEMETMRRSTSKKEESDYEDYRTDVSFGFRPVTTLNLSYSLSIQAGRPDPGPDQDRRSQAGTLSWTPSRYFGPSLSVSESRQENEDQPETLTRSYSLRINSEPLSTLDLSLGVSRNENYKDDEKQSTGYNYTLYTTAVLFPDLNSSLDLLYSTTNNEGRSEDTRTYGGQCTVTARLSPKLTADLTGQYNKTMAETDSESSAGTFTLIWRPSDIFSLRGSTNRTWEDEGDSMQYHLVLSLVPTQKTQGSLSYTYSDTTSTTESYSFFWSWDISEAFSMNFNGSYQITEEDNKWSIRGQLTARF